MAKKKKKFINVHDEVKKMHVNAYIKMECFVNFMNKELWKQRGQKSKI